jgi:hypothetical protein
MTRKSARIDPNTEQPPPHPEYPYTDAIAFHGKQRGGAPAAAAGQRLRRFLGSGFAGPGMTEHGARLLASGAPALPRLRPE